MDQGQWASEELDFSLTVGHQPKTRESVQGEGFDLWVQWWYCRCPEGLASALGSNQIGTCWEMPGFLLVQKLLFTTGFSSTTPGCITHIDACWSGKASLGQ